MDYIILLHKFEETIPDCQEVVWEAIGIGSQYRLNRDIYLIAGGYPFHPP